MSKIKPKPFKLPSIMFDIVGFLFLGSLVGMIIVMIVPMDESAMGLVAGFCYIASLLVLFFLVIIRKFKKRKKQKEAYGKEQRPLDDSQ